MVHSEPDLGFWASRVRKNLASLSDSENLAPWTTAWSARSFIRRRVHLNPALLQGCFVLLQIIWYECSIIIRCRWWDQLEITKMWINTWWKIKEHKRTIHIVPEKRLRWILDAETIILGHRKCWIRFIERKWLQKIYVLTNLDSSIINMES